MTKKNRIEDEEILDFGEDEPHLEVSSDEGDVASPVRTCIVKRARLDRRDLLRFVLTPDLEVVPDLKGNLPGRGVWTSKRKSVVEDAVRRKAFHKAFKAQVKVNPGLSIQVEGLFKRFMLDRLSIAKKAGVLIVGFAKIEDAIKRGQIVGLVHASDAAPAGCRKLNRKLESCDGVAKHTVDGNSLSSAEISLATGSANAIHAGLKAGGATSAFFHAVRCYSDYCAAVDEPALRQGKE